MATATGSTTEAGLIQSIPEGREDLTSEWFNRSLADVHDGIPEVVGLEFDVAVPQGMMSSTFRVLPDYQLQSAEAPPSFIVKLSASDPAMRLRLATRQNCLKEVRFYQSLERGLQADIGISTPRCYLADVEFDSGLHVLVLEDLRSMRQQKPETGCSRPEAERAVMALARLHARWWNTPELESLDWLVDAEPVDPAAAASRHRLWWPEFRAIAADYLPEEMLRFGELLEERFAALMNRLLFEAPRTLRHGDFSLSNLFFGEDGQPTVIDWQMMARGKGPWDLAWFMGQSLTIEQRRGWEGELLATYHEHLLGAGVGGYSADACLADYRLAIAQRFGTLISSIVALPFTAREKARILAIQVPRNVAAILDHGGLDLLD